MKKPISPEERGWDRVKIDATVNELAEAGFRVVPYTQDAGAFQYRLVFYSENGIRVIVRMLVAEWQTDSEIIVANIVTLPEKARSNGCGSEVIRIIIEWAVRNRFNEIRATQVTDPGAKRFWERNQFVRLPDPNPTGDYICKLT